MSRWNDWQGRFDDLQPRERTLFSVTAVVVVGLLVYVVAVEPGLKRTRAAREAMRDLTTQVATASSAVARLDAELARDPEAPRRAQLAELQERVSALDGELRAGQGGVLSPAQMTERLRDLIAQDPRLQVLDVRTLAPTVAHWAPPVPETAAGDGSATAAAHDVPALYRHRVEMQFSGDYAAIVAYLQRLERAGGGVTLTAVALDGADWPRIVVTLQVETLGLGEGWIGA